MTRRRPQGAQGAQRDEGSEGVRRGLCIRSLMLLRIGSRNADSYANWDLHPSMSGERGPRYTPYATTYRYATSSGRVPTSPDPKAVATDAEHISGLIAEARKQFVGG